MGGSLFYWSGMFVTEKTQEEGGRNAAIFFGLIRMGVKYL